MSKQVIEIGDTGTEFLSKLNNNIDELYVAQPKTTGSSIVGDNSLAIAGVDNTIEADNSISFGNTNSILQWVARGIDTMNAFVGGFRSKVFGWYSFAHGAECLSEGLISTSFGNSCKASGNDSVALGGCNVTGRRKFTPTAHGADDLHGLGIGVRGYVIIDLLEGDVTPLFPNEIIYDPASPTELKWALHPYCILYTGESMGEYYLIIKSEYSSLTGTKVWYDNITDLGASYWILSSYAPQHPIGLEGGNSMFAEGKNTNSVGNGAHSEGYATKAWGSGAHAEGYLTKSLANGAHSEGANNIASGLYSHSEGEGSTASGRSSHTEGAANIASGNYSSAMGNYGHASTLCQFVHGGGRFAINGDAQYSRIVTKISAVGEGWHQMLLLLPSYGKSYAAETLMIGKQFSETNGMTGESIAYKFKWYVDRGIQHNFNTTDVDVDNNTIVVSEKLKSGTKLLLSTTGIIPTGLNKDYILYVIYVDDTHIQLESSIGGGALNITSQGTGVHSYSRFNFKSVTKELIGSSFIDDGDSVGDGLTTGIRADIHQTYFGAGIVMRIDQIATRSLRWVATTHYSEVI